MKIGINALFRWKPTGVANYICNLVYHLSKIDRQNEYIVFTTKENRQYFEINQNNFKIVYCRLRSENPGYRRLWEQFVLPRYIHTYHLDLLHCPMNVLPLWSKCMTIITIIDTQYFQNPDQYSFLRKNYLKLMMQKSLSKADGIITISESVKQEMRACFRINNHKDIKAIHFGLDTCFRVVNDAQQIDEIKKEYGIQGKYILFPGYPHYRKNIPRLIAAFKRTLDQLPEPYVLVIAGEMGTDDSNVKEINEQISRQKIKDNILFTGYVPGICLRGQEEPSMTQLMNGAELMVYPSLYEGFGLPVLEAMACGTPVLSSDIPVIREVAGDAGILVNPYKIEEIADGIYRGLTDPSLRNSCITKGLERAKNFNWETNALKTLEYYQHVFDRGNRYNN